MISAARHQKFGRKFISDLKKKIIVIDRSVMMVVVTIRHIQQNFKNAIMITDGFINFMSYFLIVVADIILAFCGNFCPFFAIIKAQ